MTMSILVVDDHALVRQLLATLLRQAGYQVIVAGNGAEALDEIRRAERAPAAIILDLMMPVMDGWTFLEQRRADPQCAAIPVIVLSAVVRTPETSTAADLYALGAQAIIPKAADHADLLDTLQAVLAPAPLPS